MNQVRLLVMALVLSLGGMGAWVWKAKDNQWEAEAAAAKAEENARSVLAAKDAELQQALQNQQARHDKDLATLNEKHEQDIDDLRKSERQRMAQAFTQFSDILDGNKKTLDYINLLEEKVKSGQNISVNEAQKLATIATALGYLQKQYQKPFREFDELEAYLSKRAGANVDTPNMRFAFFKRMFSGEFRDQEREFYRTEGERRGFQDASERFAQAYSSAQKQMAAVNVDFEKAIMNLNELAAEKKTEDLTKFFNQARKALNTHQGLLEFEPEVTKPADAPRP
jgi:predicted  nucleic acid-binding Zn-ribbon protein